jgi:hypothetical protein
MGTNIKPAGGVKSKAGGKGIAGQKPIAGVAKPIAGVAKPRGVETVGIGPRIDAASAEFYKNTFGNLNSGTKHVLEQFPLFFKQALAELRDTFDRNELKLLIEMLQTGWFNFLYYKENVTNKILDVQFKGLFIKYNVEKKILSKKVKNITNFHGFVLFQLGEILVNFTGNTECDNKDFDIYEYINKLIGEDNLLHPVGNFPWTF